MQLRGANLTVAEGSRDSGWNIHSLVIKIGSVESSLDYLTCSNSKWIFHVKLASILIPATASCYCLGYVWRLFAHALQFVCFLSKKTTSTFSSSLMPIANTMFFITSRYHYILIYYNYLGILFLFIHYIIQYATYLVLKLLNIYYQNVRGSLSKISCFYRNISLNSFDIICLT